MVVCISKYFKRFLGHYYSVSKKCASLFTTFLFIFRFHGTMNDRILNTLTSSLTADHGALLDEKRITIVVVLLGFKIIYVLFDVSLSTL